MVTHKPKTIEDFISLLLDNNILKLGGETPSNILNLNSTRLRMTMLYNSEDKEDIIQDLNSIYNDVQIKSIIFGESNRDRYNKILDEEENGTPIPYTNGIYKLNESTYSNSNIKDCLVVDINDMNLLDIENDDILPLLLINKNVNIVIYTAVTKIEDNEIYKLGYLTID